MLLSLVWLITHLLEWIIEEATHTSSSEYVIEKVAELVASKDVVEYILWKQVLWILKAVSHKILLILLIWKAVHIHEVLLELLVWKASIHERLLMVMVLLLLLVLCLLLLLSCLLLSVMHLLLTASFFLSLFLLLLSIFLRINSSLVIDWSSCLVTMLIDISKVLSCSDVWWS